MKDSKEKENRISNLKHMINNMNENEEDEEIEYDFDNDEIPEDEELINFLENNDEELEIDDEYIYRPGKDTDNAINLEDENEIDENFIIETNINEELNDTEQINTDELDFEEEINENFDNLINIQIGKKPILAIISLILGIIFIAGSIIVFSSSTDRIVDNVVSGENRFITVVLFVIGLLLLIYGIYKVLNIKNPFEAWMDSMDNIEEKKEPIEKNKEPEETTIPKSNIPLDKDDYKIGEFDLKDLKANLKNSFSKNVKTEKEEPEEEVVDVENLPPARERSEDKKGQTSEEIEDKEYEKAQLDGESIDDIFADVDDLEDDDKK